MELAVILVTTGIIICLMLFLVIYYIKNIKKEGNVMISSYEDGVNKIALAPFTIMDVGPNNQTVYVNKSSNNDIRGNSLMNMEGMWNSKNSNGLHNGLDVYAIPPYYTADANPIYYDANHVVRTAPQLDFSIENITKTSQPIGSRFDPNIEGLCNNHGSNTFSKKCNIDLDNLAEKRLLKDHHDAIVNDTPRTEGMYSPWKSPDERMPTLVMNQRQYIKTSNNVMNPFPLKTASQRAYP